jgi:peptidoglycan/xylan/chitin deacetylase (PgdA/CDA1 family)
VEEIFRGEFDGAWDEGGVFLLTMHPHHIGHRSRLPLLDRLIQHMKARGDCWFCTHEQLARWCKAHAA